MTQRQHYITKPIDCPQKLSILSWYSLELEMHNEADNVKGHLRFRGDKSVFTQHHHAVWITLGSPFTFKVSHLIFPMFPQNNWRVGFLGDTILLQLSWACHYLTHNLTYSDRVRSQVFSSACLLHWLYYALLLPQQALLLLSTVPARD